MTYIEIKTYLLSAGIFKENEYFEKYISLIVDNLATRCEKYKTQVHHIIPRYYYKLNKLTLDNSSYNKINLLYKDHLLAHYYMALCTESNYSNAMVYSLTHIIGNIKWSTKSEELKQEYEIFLHSLDKYQLLYEQSKKYLASINKGRHRTEAEVQQQIKSRHENGKPWHSKETREKMSQSAKKLDHSLYNKETYHTEEFKNKISKSKELCGNGHTNKKYINNGKICYCVPIVEIDYWLKNGFILGRLTKSSAFKTVSKQVLCIELNKIFSSVSAAAKELGLQISKISLCCNGKRNKTGGYHFKFISTENIGD